MAVLDSKYFSEDAAGSVERPDGIVRSVNRAGQLAPWLAGSGIALGQAVLASSCSLPVVGKCVGCGSCVVAVAALSSWAMQRRKSDAATVREQGIEPFEIRTPPAKESLGNGKK